MTEQDSIQVAKDRLKLIEDTILKARAEFNNGAKDYIFWGWLTIVTTLIHFLLLHYTETPLHWLPWPILMTMGGIYSAITNIKASKKERVSTYYGHTMSWLWGVCGVAFFAVAFMCVYHRILPFPFILLIAGMATLISGGILKYKPLIIGGISFFIFSGISLTLSPAWQMLIFPVAIAIGYLVPGYMLKKKV